MTDRQNAAQTLLKSIVPSTWDDDLHVLPASTMLEGAERELMGGWRQSNLRVSGILVTKMSTRVRGHNHLLNELKAHSVLGKLLIGVIPANEAVSYSHQNHQSVFEYDPNAIASKAYMAVVARLVHAIVMGGA